MFDIFDKPFALLGLSVLVLFGVLTFRSVIPEKRRWWQWLIPAFCLALAFGVDNLVTTDKEKINAVINKGIKAVQNEDVRAIEALIVEDYSDSYHRTKAQLLAHCEQQFASSLIEKVTKTASRIQISSSQAEGTLFVLMTFDKNSFVAQNYIPILKFKAEIHLKKQTDSSWRITRVEILEVNNQPISWRQAQ